MKVLYNWLTAILAAVVLYGVVWLFLLQQGIRMGDEPAASTVEAIPSLIECRP